MLAPEVQAAKQAAAGQGSAGAQSNPADAPKEGEVVDAEFAETK